MNWGKYAANWIRRQCAQRAVTLRPAWAIHSLLALALIVMGQQLATLSWRVFALSEPPPPLPTPLELPVEASDASRLPNFTLFGRSTLPRPGAENDATAHYTVGVDESLPVSALSLSVTGILASNDTRRSMVIVDSGSAQRSYGVGDTLSGTDAQILAIQPERVVIRHQGRLEMLRIPGDEAAPRSAPVGKAVKEASRLSDVIAIAPILSAGAISGYRLNPGKQRELFYQAGLRDNDVAIALNGLDLRDVEQARQAMLLLKKESSVMLSVEREGQQHDLYITLEREK
ncbi:TPA: type II secretion system protein GspC [Kluyvera ascorbata]|nr:type II secretion system protein GspC [Kluyvera ascorbata]HDT6545628.1 type II secretion system protein GspC [Kluyvera ascorbata]